MINLKKHSLTSFLNKAKERATNQNEKQLVSWTKKITEAHLLTFFEVSKRFKKERAFWMNDTKDFAFVSLGHAKVITADESRYEMLQQKWDETIEHAMIHDPYKEQGTGVFAVGGMTFDPLRESSTLWENYPTNRLIIPTYCIVKNKQDYYFTMNQYVYPDDDVDQIIREKKAVEQLIEAKSIAKQSEQYIIEKNEIETETWKQTVAKAVQAMKQGKAKKIVLAREMRIKLNREANIAFMLRNLLRTEKSSYVFALEYGADCFIGATPERLVQVNGNHLLSTCLAGTAPRGKNSAEDATIAKNLLNDNKNREEHDYVVQMIKNSLMKICETLQIASEPTVLLLHHLQHLYTPISAQLKSDYAVFDIVQRLHPTPALGGVPRDETLAFIRQHENLDRGWYGAPIGWLDSNDNSEFVVAIRSGLIQGDEASLFAGCGVMRDSTPEMEYEETNVKFLPMLHALEDTND